MLILGQEREHHRVFTWSQDNELRSWREIWRHWRKNETSRKFMNCGPISTRSGKYPKSSRDYYATSFPVGKGIKSSSQTKNESVGVWSAVKLVNSEIFKRY
ncbi:hypothetical protein AVEN_105932-1 [Araneus ventricosus]|uniref:Uncharacterized protein n=1 Tax=Araneus ventricosus TaxID=182803 RepID=A0A4Y2DX92_ARAVE|nr:hypothetical protein AVEN_105932-1 [Araneus ventricosus]